MKRYFLISLCVLICAVPCFAQAIAGMGGLSGVVRDASGAVVPGAEVTVSNEAKGIRRVMQTNGAGVFAAPALVPAAGYAVSVSKEGFAPFEAKNIEILVGQEISINATLQVTATATTVEVTEATPIVEQTKTNVSQVVESGQILDLPINGRRVDTFVLLTPAVVSDGTYGLVSFRGIAGGNSFLTDGNDTTNQYYNENAGRTRISSQISQDAVQEFQVVSAAYSAEYGRASGGVINTVTRSGSNNTHGTAYWFFRNQDFNARDRYASINPDETRHQFGASLGGKLIADKLFYFFNTDFTRRDFPLVASNTYSPLFNSNGDVVATCTTASAAQCDAAKAFLSRTKTVIPREANQELLFGKLDWRPTDMHTISASFNYLRWISPNGIQTAVALTNGGGTGSNGDSTVRTRYGRLSWTGILKPNVVNEARFGWFKDRLYDEFNPDFLPEFGPLTITVANVSNIGTANYLPRLNPSENRYQFADNLTWTTGQHTVKFGFDFVNTRDYSDSLYNQWGTYSYSTFDAFALDFSGNTTGAKNWTSFSQGAGNSVVDTTIRDYNFYVQDQFRVTPALTLNYGIRYEYADVPQPEIVNADYPQTGRIPSAKTNSGPRFGIAYSFNQDRTVLRAGYGIYYARIQGGLINTLFTKNGLYQQNISLSASRPAEKEAGPVFPFRLASMNMKAASGDITFAADDMRNPYTQQGSLGIEHQITSNMGLTASYIWSRGLHLYGVRDANIGALGPDYTYRIVDAAGNDVGTYTTPTYLYANRVDKRYGRLNVVESNNNTYYNALALQFRRRMTRGLQASVNYTWSHAIDYGQRGGDSNIFFSGAPTTLFNGDYRGEKGSGSLDQRHRFVANTVWSPELTSRTGAVARLLINGWQLSQITTFASAQPDTAYVYSSGTPFTGFAYYSLNGFGGNTRVPWWPVSNIDVDQIYRTDARLSKILPLAEQVRLYVNFDVFNVFNHVSNTVIETRAFTATAGVIRPNASYGSGKASGGFPDGTNARRAQFSVRVTF